MSWRWACAYAVLLDHSGAYPNPLTLVYLNVPVCLLAFSILKISLYGVQLPKHHDVPWREALSKFDLGGL